MARESYLQPMQCEFSATEENELCPVCMLRKALAGGVESRSYPKTSLMSKRAQAM